MLERVLQGYRSSHDLTHEAIAALPELKAKGAFHVEESSYILSKRATMWSTRSDEYVCFFSVDTLTDALCEKLIRYTHEDGMARIDVKKGGGQHMCTRLTCVILCDGIEDAAIERIRKCRLHKYFRFSLDGWMEFHVAAMLPQMDAVYANAYARDTANYLKSVMHPKPNRGRERRLNILKKMFD